MRRAALAASLTLILLAGAAQDTRAENTKGRWNIGGGVSWVSTKDDIRSNAAFVLFAQPGPDGVPDTGDETILFFDPRPDDTLSRETTLDEGLRLDLNFAYGLTDWMSIQVDTGVYQADVVQLDTFVVERELVDFNGDGILLESETFSFVQSQPITAAEITQIPVSVSGVFRFLRGSPVNPYFGAGVGYIFVDAEPTPQLEEIDQFLAQQSIILKGVYTHPAFIICQGFLCPPYSGVRFEVEDATEWHLMGGLEYFVNSKFAIYFDARYNFISEDASVNVDGGEQVTFLFTSPKDNLSFCTDPIFDNYFDTNFPGGTFDRISMGVAEICRPGTNVRLTDETLIQGGKINLSAFNIGLGVRWYF